MNAVVEKSTHTEVSDFVRLFESYKSPLDASNFFSMFVQEYMTYYGLRTLTAIRPYGNHGVIVEGSGEGVTKLGIHLDVRFNDFMRGRDKT